MCEKNGLKGAAECHALLLENNAEPIDPVYWKPKWPANAEEVNRKRREMPAGTPAAELIDQMCVQRF